VCEGNRTIPSEKKGGKGLRQFTLHWGGGETKPKGKKVYDTICAKTTPSDDTGRKEDHKNNKVQSIPSKKES